MAAAPFDPEPSRPVLDRHFRAERARIERLARIRQLVFGSMDGLLVPLGVISGVAGGTGDTRAVIVAGVVEAFAGALSMGTGEFISGRSEAEVQRAEVGDELGQIREEPEYELREMVRLFELDGVAREDAQQLASMLARYPRAYAKTMVEKEFGIPFDPTTVRTPEALTMGVSYIVGSIFPLIAYFFFPIGTAFPVSIGLTIVALAVVGLIRAHTARIGRLRSIIEVVFIGSGSAAGGYFLGHLVPRFLGQ